MMELLDGVIELYNSAGFSGTVALLSMTTVLFVVMSFSRRMKSLTEAIVVLTDKVSAPYFNVDDSISLFRVIMEGHITEKTKFIKAILEKNDIHNRKKQILDNIEVKFKQITQKESELLSHYKSACGDMGQYLGDNIPWPKFMKQVEEIVFSDCTIPQKLNDLEAAMNRYVDEFAKCLRERGVRN